MCSEQQFDEFNCPKESQVGEDEATGTATRLEVLHLASATVKERFPVYNIARRPGEPARFGVEVNSETLKLLARAGHDLRGHIYLEGAISWHPEPPAAGGEDSGVASGDYHEFFRIQNIPREPELVESKLIFWGVPQQHQQSPVGRVGKPVAFITLPSTCSSKPITHLHVDSYEDPGHFLAYENERPVAATGCDQLAFNPSLSLTPETTQSDAPDGVSADLHVPQATLEPSKPNSPDVQSAQVTLPEGMSLNPSAANGLQACSDQQFDEGACPSASQVGTVGVDAPGIPNGSLTGGVYVGSPEPGQGPESGGEYRMFLIAQAPQYGVGLRLEGRERANAQTGQLTASFTGGPQVPLEDIQLHLNRDERFPGRRKRCGRCVRRAAAVLARSEHRPAEPGTGRRVQPVHVQPGARRRAAVPLADRHHAAPGSGRCDSVGPTVRRTRGERRRLLDGERDRHDRGHRGRRQRTVSVQRSRIPHRPVRRRAVWAVDRRAGAGGTV